MKVSPLFLALAVLAPAASAQCPEWDGVFGVTGVEGYVIDTVVFDDGSGPALVAVGGFTSVSGIEARNVARWDGAKWAAFGDGVPTLATAVGVFNDGTGPALYVGGDFDPEPGASEVLYRWTGSTWAATPPLVGLTGVLALQGFDDGGGERLFVAGRDGIEVWDGSSAVALNLPGFGSPVTHFAVLAGTLYAGGGSVYEWDGASWSSIGGGRCPACRTRSSSRSRHS